MKKFLLALTAIAAIAFVGCSKDSDSTDGLEGTSWTYNDSTGNETIVETIRFQSGNKATLSGTMTWANGTERYSEVGTYTYKAPDVTLRLVDEDGDPCLYTGTVSGNQLTLYEDGDFYGIFLKN